MKPIKVYELLLELLKAKADSARITENELKDYYVPEGQLLKQNYLERLASSLQNSGMMHNSIRFNESEERYNHIKNTLFNFDSEEILKKYSNWQELYSVLTNNGDFDNGIKKNTDDKRTNWGKYAKGLYCGVEFLKNEQGSEKIALLCNEPTTTDELYKKIKEIKEIEKRIHGLGFALTCDWLKECGCTWIAKPDIHIKIVCSAIDGKSETELMSDVDIIKFMFNISKEIKQKYSDVTAYKLDKMIWLICTGNFYLQKDKIGRDTILSLLKN